MESKSQFGPNMGQSTAATGTDETQTKELRLECLSSVAAMLMRRTTTNLTPFTHLQPRGKNGKGWF
ncbi:hypothetical protein MKX08_005009 [Trichoderma sp. CBMAI-0020]|nr:hypothetical protein MKX08_005009 [Trichoderma sp. CBMAI-0020]